LKSLSIKISFLDPSLSDIFPPTRPNGVPETAFIETIDSSSCKNRRMSENAYPDTIAVQTLYPSPLLIA
jgi:hypothetical protein